MDFLMAQIAPEVGNLGRWRALGINSGRCGGILQVLKMLVPILNTSVLKPTNQSGS